MDAKIKSLIENLYTKTEKREANWERIGKKDQFILVLDKGKVFIDKILTIKAEVVYQFTIMNINGDTIFSVNALKKLEFSVERQDYDILKELHEVIKKSYFKVDETIDGLLGEINKEGEIGNEFDDLPF
jgi:hypothetical protein